MHASTYRWPDGKVVTDRLTDPYGVAFQSGAWYLVAWDHLRGEVRTFRLDRVLHCEVTREAFQRPSDFDVASYVQKMLATLPWAWQAEVLLETSLREARRRIPPTLGTLEQHQAGVLLRIGADDLGWLASYLAGLEVPFSVMQPAELRTAIRTMMSSNEPMIMSPFTAMPYAPASALDDPNPSTSDTTPSSISQFTSGT